MAKEKKTGWKKWLGYASNVLFLAIVLILIIPTWRSAFQTWFQSMTLSEVTFETSGKKEFPQDQRNWEVVKPSGELFNFAEFEGTPVVLSFWATWCSACMAEFPDLGQLRKEFNNEIAFVAVTTESMAVVEKSGMMDDYDFLYCTQDYPEFFEVEVFPTLAILDKEMNMVYRMEGAADINNEENVAFLNDLLEKP